MSLLNTTLVLRSFILLTFWWISVTEQAADGSVAQWCLSVGLLFIRSCQVMFYLLKYSKTDLIYRTQTSALLFLCMCTRALLVTAIPKTQFQHNLAAVLLHPMASVWWQPAWRHMFVDESMETWINSAVGIISLPLHTSWKVNAPLFALCKQCSCCTRQTVCRRVSFLFWF